MDGFICLGYLGDRCEFGEAHDSVRRSHYIAHIQILVVQLRLELDSSRPIDIYEI